MPSQFIFPDKEIVFDVELLNVGEHIYSYFLIAQDVDAETSALGESFNSIFVFEIPIKLVLTCIFTFRDSFGHV